MSCFPGHCKRLAPTWKELADAVDENKFLNIAHVDCTTSKDVCNNAKVSMICGFKSGRWLLFRHLHYGCQRYLYHMQVQGYPTLKVYHKGEEIKAYRGEHDWWDCLLRSTAATAGLGTGRLIHIMKCHSKKCRWPCTSSRHKNSEMEQGCLWHAT